MHAEERSGRRWDEMSGGVGEEVCGEQRLARDTESQMLSCAMVLRKDNKKDRICQSTRSLS
jgi:hypothetical protein